MKRYLPRIISAVTVLILLVCSLPITAFCSEEEPLPFDLDCKSAVLMEAETGRVLYEKNKDEALPPASVTKVMTLLLVMEAVDGGKLSLDDVVQVSEYAASMGGSQVYLEPGEEMSVEELIKCVVIASANDAAVTLAEAVAGSETSFIDMMNERAESLGMKNTHFENATGLDDTVTDHVTSAADIAIMSRELISHPEVLKYSSVWMDSIRGGAFGLTNTNRLVRFYKGATGLKTGSTSKAKFCISATARRDGMHLIAVIMGAPTRDIRNEEAKKLLDYGFANYSLYRDEGGECGSIRIVKGVEPDCAVRRPAFSALLPKGDAGKVKVSIETDPEAEAPVIAGDAVGRAVYSVDGKEIGSVDVVCSGSVPKLSFFGLFLKMLSYFTIS